MPFRSIASFRALFPNSLDLLLPAAGSLFLRAGGMGSTFALGVVLARTLGPAQYGIYGLITTLAAVAMNIALLGTPQLAVREFAVLSAGRDWSRARALANRFLQATCGAAAVTGVIALAAVTLLNGDDANILWLSLIGIALAATMAVTALTAAELRGLGLLIKGQFMDIIGRSAGQLVLTVGVVMLGLRLSSASALVILLTVSLLSAAVSLGWMRAAIPTVGSILPDPGWRWLKASLPLGAVDILRQADGSYGIILLGFMGSARDLGLFRVALAAGVLASMPVTILHVVLAPTVSRLFRFGELYQLQQLLRTASALMCLLLVPMLIGLFLFGRVLVAAVFGSAYADAWVPLAMLCGTQLVFGFFGMGPILLAMADSETHLALIYVAAVAAGTVAAALLIPVWGIGGAAAAQLISTGGVALLSDRFSRKQLGLGTTFLARQSRPASTAG